LEGSKRCTRFLFLEERRLEGPEEKEWGETEEEGEGDVYLVRFFGRELEEEGEEEGEDWDDENWCEEGLRNC